MNDLLNHYEHLYRVAATLVYALGFMACLLVAALGALFQNKYSRIKPIDWAEMRHIKGRAL